MGALLAQFKQVRPDSLGLKMGSSRTFVVHISLIFRNGGRRRLFHHHVISCRKGAQPSPISPRALTTCQMPGAMVTRWLLFRSHSRGARPPRQPGLKGSKHARRITSAYRGEPTIKKRRDLWSLAPARPLPERQPDARPACRSGGESCFISSHVSWKMSLQG